MDTHELESSPSDSDDSEQTPDTTSQDLLPPPPPSQNLGDLSNSSNPDDPPNFYCLISTSDETLNNQADSALHLNYDALVEDKEEKDAFRSSPPLNSVSAVSSSHWSSTPWSSGKGTRNSDSGWRNWVSERDTKPSAYDWSETWLSGATDTKLFDSDWSEPLLFLEETEPKPLASVSLAARDEVKSAMVGAGLANLGNTCFLNAILQCLTHTVPLVQGLMLYDHPSPCDREIEGFCVLCALRSLIELSLASMGRVVSPWKLVNNLRYISSDFRRFQQEDAHEFLQCLLDRLDTCLSSEDENLVKQVFGGRLISKLQCCNCGHCSDTFEPLIDLSLEIENVSNLSSSLESFTKVEKIEDSETKFTCENCKEEVSVEKQLLLDQAPSVAAFHLKRFKNDGSYVEKIDKHVEFPLELDLLPYVDDSQNNDVELKYDLLAVVVHIGFSSTSGHYYSFIRSGPDSWYMLDDSKVTRVREDFVLSQEAYILFYAKQGTPWLSSLMETKKVSLDLYAPNNSPNSVLDNVDHICAPSPNLSNNPSCEANEAREDGYGFELDSTNGSINGDVEAKEAKDSHALLTPITRGTDSSCKRMSCYVEKKISPSALRDYSHNKSFNEVEKSANITLLTPPRSPSPDIYAEDLPVMTYSIPRGDLMSEKQLPCKRELVNNLDDSQRKQACKLLKGMPNDRKSKLLATMNGDDYPNSKRSKNYKHSSTRSKANVGNYKHVVAAGW